MIYNKRAVEYPIQITEEHSRLARHYSPFRLRKETCDELIDMFDKRKKGLNRVLEVVETIHSQISYDYEHAFEGTRNAEQTWQDKKGHCIEQQTLLYASLKLMGARTGLLIAKNPKGYNGAGVVEVGIHPFLIYKHNNKTYKVDSVTDSVSFFKKNGFCLSKQHFNFREFVAFWVGDAAEDLGLNHGKYDEAVSRINTALKIDPNNYTLYITLGDIYWNKGIDFKLEKNPLAENAYKKAIEIAPNLVDPYASYIDFLFNCIKNSESRIVRLCKTALSKRVSDIQVMNSLERIMKKIGEKDIAAKAREIKETLINRKEIREYFNS